MAVSTERASLARILKFVGVTAGDSCLGRSRLMITLAGPMANSCVSVNSGGFSNKLGIYPFHRRGFVGDHHVPVLRTGTALISVFGGVVDSDLWLLELQTVILPRSCISQTAESVVT